MKIRAVGAELCHADGQTDMTKLRVAFSQFCGKRLKNEELTAKSLTEGPRQNTTQCLYISF